MSESKKLVTSIIGPIINPLVNKIIAGPDFGPEELDQSQTALNSTGGIGSSAWQSFQPGFEGKLTKIDFKIGAITATPFTITMNIRTGEGLGGSIVDSTNFLITTAPISFRTFIFSNEPTLQKDTLYTIELDYLGETCNFHLNTLNPYSRGRWVQNAAWDGLFETYMKRRL